MTARGPFPGPVARQSEAGALAIMLALAVSTMLMLLVTIVFQVSSYNTTSSSFRLEQAQAFDAAEGGLDLVIGEIKQAGKIPNLPCSLATTGFSTSPGASSASATVTYYSSYGSSGPSGQLSCTSGSGPSGSQVQAAIVVATGQAGRGPGATAYAEAELTLAKVLAGTVFDDALFSDQSLVGANNPTIYGDPPGEDNANLYSNGSLTCGNGFGIQGSVDLMGSFTGTNNCTVNGDVVAAGSVSLANFTTVTGSVYAGNVPCPSPPSPTSTITLFNNAVIDQSAYACGAINVSGNSTIVHTTAADENPLPAAGAVPTQSLPVWTNPATDSAAASAWVAAGYTVKNDGSSCAQVYNDITSVTSPTVITTSCALSWSTSVTIQTNVAIVSTGGFTMTNNTSWLTNGSTTRLLYVLVPSPETCVLGSPGITLANNTSFATTVNVLFYTPCTMTISNNNAGYGQIYAGEVDATNHFVEHYVPVPTPGATGGGTYMVLDASFVFERQLIAPPSSLPS